MHKLLAIATLLCTCCAADTTFEHHCAFEADCDRVYDSVHELCPIPRFAYWCDCEIMPAHCIPSDRYPQLICCLPKI